MSDPTLWGRQFLVIFHLHHSLRERGTGKRQTSVPTLLSLPGHAVRLSDVQTVVSQFLPLGSEPAALGIKYQWKEDTGAARNEADRSMAGAAQRCIQGWAARTQLSSLTGLLSDPTVRVQSIILKARSERQVLPTGLERKPITMGGGWGHRNHGPTAWYFPLPTPAPMDLENDHHSSSKIHLYCCLLLLHPSKL